MKEAQLLLPETIYQLLGFYGLIGGMVVGSLQIVIYLTRAYVNVQRERFQQQKIETARIIAFLNEFNTCKNDIAALKKNEEINKLRDSEMLSTVESLDKAIESLGQNFTDFLINISNKK